MDFLAGPRGNPRASVIDQYKAYFKSINIEHYGAGILLSALAP